jgi:hypothetical protein
VAALGLIALAIWLTLGSVRTREGATADPIEEGAMNPRDFSGALDPASEAILRVQRELLLKLGSELLASQRAALAAVQSEMEETSREITGRMALWRSRTVGTISLSTAMLVPWLLALGLLGAATLVLGAKAHDTWTDYRAAEAAVEGLRVRGAVTVIRGNELYVRVDPDSLSRGARGNWYARAVDVQFESGGPPAAR